MASPEWLSPDPEGAASAVTETSSANPPEPTKSDLSKLIAEVAARYSEAVPSAPPEPGAQMGSYAWTRGGAGFLPGDEGDAAAGGDGLEQRLAREVAQLKKTLEAQQRATDDAERNAAQLSEQLASTRAQVEKGMKQVHGGQRARIERAESSVAQMKTEMHMAQRHLESERRARRAEAVSAAAKVAEAESARSSAVAAQAAAKSRTPTSFQVRLGLTAAASFAAVAAILLYWGFAPSVAGLTTAAPAPASAAASSQPTAAQQIAGQSAAVQPRSIQPGPSVKGAAPKPADKADEGDFSQSMDRLTKALSQFPGLAPEEVLRQISLTNSAPECAFNWNNGNPSLIFTGGKISMAQALNRCAAAIEKFR